MTRVLFVCMGNICRSPLAAAALKSKAAERMLEVATDSAGTHDFHVGEGADPRAVEAGGRRGYNLAGHRARQVAAGDFVCCELLIAMDRGNLDRLRQIAPSGYDDRLHLLLQFAPELGVEDIPDPYYGGSQAFERALDLIDIAVDGVLGHLEPVA